MPQRAEAEVAHRSGILPALASSPLCRLGACIAFLTLFLSVGAAAQHNSRDLVNQCADAAASWWLGRTGIVYEAIEPKHAIPICEAATREAADNGDVWAVLARAYGRAERFEEAWAATDRAIERRSPAGFWERGKAYDFGDGVERQPTEAAEWYRKAAEQGFPPAQYNLGVLHLNGDGVEEDFDRASLWHRKAAEQGYMSAILDHWETPDASWTINVALDQSVESRTADLLIEQLDSGKLEWWMLEALVYMDDRSVVEWLIRRLNSEDPRWRELAARALGLRGEPRAAEPLAELLDDDTFSVRYAAVRALGQIGGSKAAALLAGALVDSDLRIPIAYALAALGDRRAVEPLIALLRDEHKDVRRSAADALGALGDLQAVKPLIALLRDEDVREAAAEAIIALGDPSAVEPLFALFQDEDEDEDVRGEAAWVLGALGDPSVFEWALALLDALSRDERGADSDDWFAGLNVLGALEALIRSGSVEAHLALLTHEDEGVRESAAIPGFRDLGDLGGAAPLIALLVHEEPDVRLGAAEALGELGDPKAVGPLLALLQDEDGHVRREAAEALGALGDPSAVEPLITLLRDEDEDVRRKAAEALGELGDPSAVEPLLALLQDEDGHVRREAAEALGALGDPSAVEPLITLLRDEDEDVRWRAAEALGELGDPKAVGPLLALLQDEDGHVRREAAEALGALGDPSAVEPLLGLLRDEHEDEHLRMAAASALQALGGSGSVEALLALLRYRGPGMILQAGWLFFQFGDPSAVEPLIALLRDEDEYVRWRAAEALGALGDPSAVEPLITLLRDEDEYVRREAAEALGELGDPSAVEPLITLLRDEDENVRWRAAEALGALGDPSAVEPLITLHRDEDGYVHREAAKVLGALGDPRAVGPLVALLQDENWYVSETAAEALGNSDVFWEKVVAISSATERTKYLRIFAVTDEYRYGVLLLSQKLTARRPDLYDELRLPVLREIWSWRYQRADVTVRRVEEDLRTLSSSSTDAPSPYTLLLAAILAVGDRQFQKALDWADQGIDRADRREVAVHLALSVVKAEALVGLDRPDKALRVIENSHGELDRLVWREREEFPELELEVLATRGFVLSILGRNKDAIETLDHAEMALRRARWLEHYDDHQYERLLGARIAPIRALAYRSEAEADARLAKEYFNENAPRSIQEEYGWEALTGQKIERALERGDYDVYVEAHQWVESGQLKARRETGNVRLADEDRQAAYDNLAMLNIEIARLKRELERLKRGEKPSAEDRRGSGKAPNDEGKEPIDKENDEKKKRLQKKEELRKKQVELRRFVGTLKRQFPDIAAMWAAAPTEVAQLHEKLDVSGANSGGPQARRHLSRSRRYDDAPSSRYGL